MQEAEVLVVLAEIAGVFVGFGALIAVRSGGPSDSVEVAFIRWVMSAGVWVMVTALAPVVIGGYDIGEREVWLVCGLVALAGLFAVWYANFRTPESQETLASTSHAEGARGMVPYVLLVVPMLGALILVVLGLFPEQEPALYLTAVVLGLFVAAVTLAELVFMRRGPQVPASDEAEPPAE